MFSNTVLYFLHVFIGTQSSNTPSGMIYLMLMIWYPLETLMDNLIIIAKELDPQSWI